MNASGIPDFNQENHLNYSVENIDCRSNYLFQTPVDSTLPEKELVSLTSSKKSSQILLVACDPRYEASILNVRLRRQSLLKDKALNIFSIGQPLDLTYSHKHLGNGVQTLMSLLLGQNPCCPSFLPKTGFDPEPLIILGFSLLRRKDSQATRQAINH